MNRMQKINYFTLGVIVAVLLSTMATPAFAALMSKAIQVSTGVNIYLDDNKFIPMDAYGNQVEVFIYNGTTYLPARAISEAIGKPVQWEGSTSSVYIGKHSSDNPAVMIYDLSTFTGSKFYLEQNATDNLGTRYTNVACKTAGYGSPNETVYRLNGVYSSIRGTNFILEREKNTDHSLTLSFYGDGKLLYTSYVQNGLYPDTFNVDITGVLELTIKTSGTNLHYRDLYVANFGLYT